MATVPSIILSKACWTPSRMSLKPEPAGPDLVDFVDVDDAALGSLNVPVGGQDQLGERRFHVLADIPGFGEPRGIGDGERDVEELRQATSPGVSSR